MWLAPALSFLIEAIGQVRGDDFHMPPGLSWVFGVAILYYICHLIYKYQCPPDLADIQDATGALVRNAEQQEKLLSVVRIRMESMEAARRMAEDVIENHWKGKSAFSTKELDRLKPIIIRRYLKEIDNCRALSAAMMDGQRRNFGDLDASKPLSRYAAAAFLWSSVIAALLHALHVIFGFPHAA